MIGMLLGTAVLDTNLTIKILILKNNLFLSSNTIRIKSIAKDKTCRSQRSYLQKCMMHYTVVNNINLTKSKYNNAVQICIK